MENKINGGMGSSTSFADSTDGSNGVGDLIESGFSKPNVANEPQPLACMSAVRNSGNVGALCHGPNSSNDATNYKDCDVGDSSVAARNFYSRADEYLKPDGVPWPDYVKVPRAKDAAPESLQGASLRLSSTSGACKFIKDEKEPSVIMDTPCPVFELSSEIRALDACYDTDRKQQLGLGDGESTSFTQIPAGPQAAPETSPNFLVDLEQLPQVRTDSRCSLPGKAMLGFDAMTNAHAPQQLMVYKNEVPRWSTQPPLAEAPYWCQSTGVPEDQFPHSVYDGIQNAAFSQRSPPNYAAFPGMPPQRLCVICGDEASGCHYGVLTCGSCKVFFKRAVEGHHSYLCAGRNDCIVDKIRRKNCPACRLRKCYQAGMMLGGRKLKRFGALKALSLAPSLMFQSHLTMSSDNQALTSMSCMPGIREAHFSQQFITILENIEPDTVYAGHDNTKSDIPHILLNSLNRLCERQLVWIVRWSKSLPGFRSLHINDQMTLIQYSWMNLMVFCLGWRSFQNVTSEFLYFAPDLVLSQEQMRKSPIYDLCLAMQFIPQEFANLQVTREEFLCMKALILLNTVPLEGLKSQTSFDEMRQNYIRELTKVIHMREKDVVASSQRFYHLTKLMDAMHEIVKKVNLYCLSTFIQADAMKVEFPEMMSEVIASQLPKILAGMVRPLLFHGK
ncbi:progesterone receptor [Myripristis murdjan]|uniref:Progesterone receptor n=1 Tax=Myripristis murdjan TaxID=586833 RepID=A0A667ZLI9_9TELE|nr:progesterone receptor [Myripristis murdjan]